MNEMTELNPLGRALELTYGDQSATIMEVGASLYSYKVAGQDVAAGPTRATGVTDVHKGSRGAVLIPWPNRVKAGKYSVDCQSLQLPVTNAGDSHATHGFVRLARWDVDAQSDASITLSTTTYAQPGWPFVFRSTVTYSLDDAGLSVAMSVTNVGPGKFPLVIGVHPYFTVGTNHVDTCELTVKASTRLTLDETLIPDGETEVAGSEFDFNSPRVIGDQEIDVTFTGLERDRDGRASVTLQDPNGHGLRVWMDSTFDYLQIFSGDTLGVVDDRRRTLAIEPMTGAPNAFNSGDGLLWLESGESVDGRWGVSVIA